MPRSYPDYAFSELMDQSKPIPDLLSPQFSHDPVSSALRVWSQGVEEFSVQLFGDSTIFWPPTTEMLVPDYDLAADPPRPPFWARLKKLKIELRAATPRGGWYFRGLRDETRVDVGYRITDDLTALHCCRPIGEMGNDI